MNTKQQGAIGVAKAIAFYASAGYAVFAPISDWSRYDLVVEKGGVLSRVEVKTTRSKAGHVELRTSGGNRSWSGVVKRISPGDCDLVYIVNLNTGTERQFSVKDLEGRSSINII